MIRRRLQRLSKWPPTRFVFAALLLAWPWRWLGNIVAAEVECLVRALLVVADVPIDVAFELRGGPTVALDAWHLPIYLEDLETSAFVQTVLDLRRSGALASAIFVALVIATPTTRAKTKLVIGCGGLLALQALPLLPLLSFLSGKLPVRVFHFGAIARWGIEIAYHALVAAPGMAYALPALLWVALVWLFEPASLQAAAHALTPKPRTRAPTPHIPGVA